MWHRVEFVSKRGMQKQLASSQARRDGGVVSSRCV